MKHTSARPWPAGGAKADQRRNPRLEIFGRLHGHLVALDAPVAVTGISLGGLGFESSIEFPIGAVHEFRLSLNDVASVRLKGRIVHCRAISEPDEAPRYAAGAEFLDDSSGVAAGAIRDLLERVRVA